MKISLIICTYNRPVSLMNLLTSIDSQILLPNEILIVDGSTNLLTKDLIMNFKSKLNLKYFLVDEKNRGLTKQRNFGISNCSPCDIVSFLDDDLILNPNYFKILVTSFSSLPDAIGLSGIDLIENQYFKKDSCKKYNSFFFFEIDGWLVPEPKRYLFRKLFGLMPSFQPCIIPPYSHGRSCLPPNGKIYKVDHFWGGIASYKFDIFSKVSFSNYFEGYGLYEDVDFCIRISKFGSLYIDTNLNVFHFHDPIGRPNFYKFGQMVVKNGWYVWKQKYQSFNFYDSLRWYLIEFINAFSRLLGVFNASSRVDSFLDFSGRVSTLFKLLFRYEKFN